MENWDAQVVDIKEGWTQKKGRTYSTWTCKEKLCRKFLSVFSYFCQNKHHFQLGITAVQTAIATWIQSNDSRGRKKNLPGFFDLITARLPAYEVVPAILLRLELELLFISFSLSLLPSLTSLFLFHTSPLWWILCRLYQHYCTGKILIYRIRLLVKVR